MSLDTITLGLDGLLGISLVAIAAFTWKLTQSFKAAPRLPPADAAPPEASIDVIIPAYNEAENIRACVAAVLTTDLPGAARFEVWIADDQSTDATGSIAAELAAQHAPVHHLTVPPRPAGEVWHGKNWACAHTTRITDC